MEIKNVIICGLGAIGLTYANKLKNVCELRILADKSRVDKYKTTPPVFNGKATELKYITPEDDFRADLIIISTKNNGLEPALDYIKNFVGENTIIISLINGITSEEKIAERYGKERVLHSYFIGHSAVREGNSVTQDGIGKIFFGTPYKENKEMENSLRQFFDKNKIDYEIPADIIYSMWLKYTLNVFSNQLSAIMNLTFGEMKNEKFIEIANKIIDEVKTIAEKEGVNGCEKLKEDSVKALYKMTDEGKTSMLQDILSGRKTEVEIFSGEIIRRAEKYGINVPYNRLIYDMIKILEEVKCK